jgi:hypothetical protein
MGTLVATELVSVDGVFEDPGGAEDYEHGGWTFEYDRGEDGDKFTLDEVMEPHLPAPLAGLRRRKSSRPARPGAAVWDA